MRNNSAARLLKRISRAPIYHTRWKHRALYNNTNDTHTHTHTHTHTERRSAGNHPVTDSNDSLATALFVQPTVAGGPIT